MDKESDCRKLFLLRTWSVAELHHFNAASEFESQRKINAKISRSANSKDLAEKKYRYALLIFHYIVFLLRCIKFYCIPIRSTYVQHRTIQRCAYSTLVTVGGRTSNANMSLRVPIMHRYWHDLKLNFYKVITIGKH
jgi:hypothetical protein